MFKKLCVLLKTYECLVHNTSLISGRHSDILNVFFLISDQMVIDIDALGIYQMCTGKLAKWSFILFFSVLLQFQRDLEI